MKAAHRKDKKQKPLKDLTPEDVIVVLEYAPGNIYPPIKWEYLYGWIDQIGHQYEMTRLVCGFELAKRRAKQNFLEQYMQAE